MRILIIGVLALFAVSACGKTDQPAEGTVAVTTPAADRAHAAALTANAIAANPASADSILKAGGYTPDGFQKLMYEIAADSTMSAGYAAARGR
jgi:hypothetical protein